MALFEIGGGTAEVALAAPGVAAIVECDDDLGIELDRLIVVGDGVVEVALDEPDDAAIVVGGGIFRIEPYGRS